MKSCGAEARGWSRALRLTSTTAKYAAVLDFFDSELFGKHNKRYLQIGR